MSAIVRRPAWPRLPWVGIAIGVAINAVILVYFRDRLAVLFSGRLHPHGPDLALLARQPLATQLHIGAAFLALAVAVYLLAAAKGTRVHRLLGWGWSAAMMATALSSFFIMDLNRGRLSWLHILSGFTAMMIPLAVWAARSHRVRLHRQTMTGMVVGGLFVAGLLTLTPGRLLWRVFFG